MDEIIRILRGEIDKLLHNPEEYMRFLETAGNNYTYSFANQLLIHANRPYTKAVATYEEWNQKYHRYVNRGSRAFPLFSGNGDGIKRAIAYEDTNRFDGKEIYFWKIDKKNHLLLEEILEEHSYLELENAEIRALMKGMPDGYAAKQEEELYRYMRATVYALILARTNTEHYRTRVKDYIAAADFDHIKNLDTEHFLKIGGGIKEYVYGILNELRVKEAELRRNGASENILVQMREGKRLWISV